MSKKKSTRKTKGSAKKTSRRKAPSKRAKPTTTKRKKAAPRRTTSSKVKTKDRSKRLSALDAAALVLSEIGQPLQCNDMVELMLEHNYWTTKGKTPEATLYSAILREIQKKGKDARFKKVGRGMFVIIRKR